jgi:hypothetical protein
VKHAVEIQKALQENSLDLQPGDLVMDDDGDILRVDRVWYDAENSYTNKNYRVRVALSSKYNDGKWHRYGDVALEEFITDGCAPKYVKADRPLEDIEKDAVAAMANPDAFGMEEINEDNIERAMVVSGGDQHVRQLRTVVTEKLRAVELIRRTMEAKRERLSQIASSMRESLTVMQKVIGALELYLGVYEEITQIRDGMSAPEDEPIHLRQLILYMDEECGDPRPNRKTGQPGIDFASVEDFDEWLLKDDHLDKMMPEQKGIVAICPSRQKREYDKNPFWNAELNARNRMTYLLIRNGQRVYRIWTSTMISDRLYPGDDEMEKLIATVQEHGRHWRDGREAADKDFSYKRNALLLQGIVDRTDVFKPMTHIPNLFDPATYLGLIIFVRDGELALHTGREYYNAWHERINAGIKRGSRIVLAGVSWYRVGKSHRFARSYGSWRSETDSSPQGPSAGVYTVEDIEPDKDRPGQELLVIYYNPGDQVWYGSGWEYDPHPRKNRLSFRVQRNEWFVLNYDQISLDDVEYYIASRIERKDYLEVLSTLWAIREARLEEIEYERQLVKLIVGRQECNERAVWQAIEWWKIKNVWKRPIGKDDSLALRMIEKRLKHEKGITS